MLVTVAACTGESTGAVRVSRASFISQRRRRVAASGSQVVLGRIGAILVLAFGWSSGAPRPRPPPAPPTPPATTAPAATAAPTSPARLTAWLRDGTVHLSITRAGSTC